MGDYEFYDLLNIINIPSSRVLKLSQKVFEKVKLLGKPLVNLPVESIVALYDSDLKYFRNRQEKHDIGDDLLI